VRIQLSVILGVLSLPSPAALATPVAGTSAAFWLGLSNNNFTVVYDGSTGAPGLNLLSVEIALAGGLLFDTLRRRRVGGFNDVTPVLGAVATGFNPIYSLGGGSSTLTSIFPISGRASCSASTWTLTKRARTTSSRLT